MGKDKGSEIQKRVGVVGQLLSWKGVKEVLEWLV